MSGADTGCDSPRQQVCWVHGVGYTVYVDGVEIATVGAEQAAYQELTVALGKLAEGKHEAELVLVLPDDFETRTGAFIEDVTETLRT
eukprot:243869-Rhodomonas_salina.2